MDNPLPPEEAFAPVTDEGQLVRCVEALLFAAGRTVTLDELATAAEVDCDSLLTALDELDETLRGRGVQLLRLAGGYRLVTRPELAEAVRRLLQPAPVKMTSARLETLAVIAYRQPVTKAEVDAIRGVDCGGTIRSLIDLGLVDLRGRRRDKPGRPLLYGTTPRFLDEFGLDTLEDLPRLEELES